MANIRGKNLLLQYEQEIERLQKDVEHLKLKLEQAEKQHDRQQRGSGTDSPDIDSSEQDSTHDLRDPPSPGQGDTNMKNIIARSVLVVLIQFWYLPPSSGISDTSTFLHVLEPY